MTLSRDLFGPALRWNPVSYVQLLCGAWNAAHAPRTEGAPTVVSTFAGGGGSSLGYAAAGFRELAATDWEARACEALRTNFPDLEVLEGDITEMDPAEVRERLGLERGELDVLDGSPPCQGFSTAGRRRLTDSRNRLFEEYVRWVREFEPRAIVMENVTGLVKGRMKKIFVEILTELKGCGYQVRAWTLNAMHYHVPQSRQRVIFIGLREDLGIDPTPPRPESRPITVREATGIGGIRLSGHGYFDGGRVDGGEPSSVILGTGMGSFAYDVERDQIVPALAELLSTQPAIEEGVETFDPRELANALLDARNGESLKTGNHSSEATGSLDAPAGALGTSDHGRGGVWPDPPGEQGGKTRTARTRTAEVDVTAEIVVHGGGFGRGRRHSLDAPAGAYADVCDDAEVVIGNDAYRARFGSPDDGPSPTICATPPSNEQHGTTGMVRDVRPPESIEGTVIEGEAEKLEEGQQSESERFFSLKREDPEREASCVQASHGGRGTAAPIHPTEARKFTIAELKVLSSFPLEFELSGKYRDQWRLIGNAVPPLMMEAIARHIRELLES